jgi:uncharacterized protein (DUF1778 family)
MRLDPEETILLSQKDFEQLLATLESPPKPTQAMIEAIKKYRERFNDEETEA